MQIQSVQIRGYIKNISYIINIYIDYSAAIMRSTNTNQTTVNELQSKTFAIKPGILGRAMVCPAQLPHIPHARRDRRT